MWPALRAKDLSSQWQYLQLAEFCGAQGHDEEALRRAEEGLWLFEDERPDERLVFLTAELLVKAGRKKDAEARLWRAFEKSPSLALHAQLRKLGGKAAGVRAVEFVEGGLAKQTVSPWHHPADLLIRILMEEKMPDAAWAAVHRHGATMGVRESLARASEATHPKAAVDVYAERVEQLAGSGGNPAYAQAADLVARMAKLRSATEQAAYVTALKLHVQIGTRSIGHCQMQ
jgi:tetratricopeptide (TPR) repeat protein